MFFFKNIEIWNYFLIRSVLVKMSNWTRFYLCKINNSVFHLPVIYIFFFYIFSFYLYILYFFYIFQNDNKNKKLKIYFR